MQAAEKLKIALDETRMLVLGAQVLLGFQLRSAFAERFADLSPTSRLLDAIALILMTLVVGLLIAPAAHLRIVDEGDVTARTFALVSTLMATALVPFALSLGINLFIVLEQMVTPALASASAVAITAVALWFWFGLGLRALHYRNGKDMEQQQERISLIQKIDQMLTEARVIVPGAQTLLGFQLAVVLTESFDKLPSSSKAMHAVALGLIALSVILLMAPAAYHRIVYAGAASAEFLALSSRFVMAATISMALGLSADIYVVIAKIAASSSIGLAAAVVALLTLIGLWHVAPVMRRAQAAQHAAVDNKVRQLF